MLFFQESFQQKFTFKWCKSNQYRTFVIYSSSINSSTFTIEETQAYQFRYFVKVIIFKNFNCCVLYVVVYQRKVVEEDNRERNSYMQMG